MKNNLINILANSNKELDNQLLMDYVSGKLSHADQHAVEEWLEDNEFAADALEGLQEFGNKDQLQEYVRQLNLELKAFLLQKKTKAGKKGLERPALDLYSHYIHTLPGHHNLCYPAHACTGCPLSAFIGTGCIQASV